MGKVFCACALLVLGGLAGACSSPDSSDQVASCEVGNQYDCVCGDGSHGVQTCQSGGGFGLCMQCGNAEAIAPSAPTSSGASTPETPGASGDIRWLGADPCENYDSGFPGDEQCLAAPDPSIGFQLHYGPRDYSNPTEVNAFSLAPGGEITDCMFMRSPNTTDVFLNEYHARLRPGSHHMITYQESAEGGPRPDSLYPEPCNQGPFFTFWVGATSATTDIGGQDPNEAPEDVGLALKAEANSELAVQMHFINTSDQPIIKEGWINVIYFPADQVREEVDPITWLGGIGMNIPPGAQQTLTGTATADTPRRIVTLVAHAHASTVRVATYLNDRLIYENYDWADPAFISYNTVTENPAPDPATGTAGGHSGILQVAPGDQLRWECEVHNDTSVNLTFGNGVYDKEMCNMFGVYSPTAGGPWGAVAL